MTDAAILTDGGYLLKRLPVVRQDVDVTDADAVAKSVDRLVRGHLSQLNHVYRLQNTSRLLYRVFYYDARPYAGKAHTPILLSQLKRAGSCGGSSNSTSSKNLNSSWIAVPGFFAGAGARSTADGRC